MYLTYLSDERHSAAPLLLLKRGSRPPGLRPPFFDKRGPPGGVAGLDLGITKADDPRLADRLLGQQRNDQSDC